MAFYDLGFGLEADGQACGKLGESEDECAHAGEDMLSSGQASLTSIFNQWAAE